MTRLTRDVMTPDPRCIGENDSLHIAATIMSEFDIGALPICGEDAQLKGILTDRDIVVKAVAVGLDLETTPAGALAGGTLITVEPSADIDAVIERMQEHRLRRIPVISGQRLVGIVSQADIARECAPHDTGVTVEHISREGT